MKKTSCKRGFTQIIKVILSRGHYLWAASRKVVIRDLIKWIQDLRRLLLSSLNSVRGRYPAGRPLKYGMTSLFNNGGFTLIELLVVVLIIGILAAVAVPQYQKAVSKAQLQRILPLMSAIDRAEQIYFWANGTYTADYTQLDVQMPEADSEVANNYSGQYLSYKDFGCNFVKAKDEYSIRCSPTGNLKIPDIEKKFALTTFSCWATKTSPLLNSVCASIPATLDETNENAIFNKYLF